MGRNKSQETCRWLGWPTSSEGKPGGSWTQGPEQGQEGLGPRPLLAMGSSRAQPGCPSAQSCSGQAASELGPHLGLCFLGLWLRSSRAGTIPTSLGSARAPQLGSRSLPRAGASGQSLPSATGARVGVGTLVELAAACRADGEERGVGSHQRRLQRKAAVGRSTRHRARPPASLPLDSGKRRQGAGLWGEGGRVPRVSRPELLRLAQSERGYRQRLTEQDRAATAATAMPLQGERQRG